MEHCKEQNNRGNICKYSTIFSRSTAAPPVALQHKVTIVLKGWVSNRHHFTELCDNSLSPITKMLCLPSPSLLYRVCHLAWHAQSRLPWLHCWSSRLHKRSNDSRPYNHTASKHSTTITLIISFLFTFRKRKKEGDPLSISTKCEQLRFIFDLLQFLSNMTIRGHTFYTSHQIFRTPLKILWRQIIEIEIAFIQNKSSAAKRLY